MKTVTDFEPFVLAYTPFIPAELVQHAIRETIVEFMRETKCASATLEFETQEKVPDYMLEVPDCRRIVKVKNVYITPTKCSGRENWRLLNSGEFGDYIIELRIGEHPIIILTNPPKQPNRVKVDYYWAIGRDDCDIPDFIYEDYMKAIVAGSLIRLASLPDNQHIAAQIGFHQQTWFDGVQQAKIDKSGGKARRLIGAPILTRRRGSLWR